MVDLGDGKNLASWHDAEQWEMIICRIRKKEREMDPNAYKMIMQHIVMEQKTLSVWMADLGSGNDYLFDAHITNWQGLLMQLHVASVGEILNRKIHSLFRQ